MLRFLLIIVSSSVLSFTVYAQEGLGVGIRLGDPSGISLKKYIGDNKALELNIGTPTHYRGYDWRYYYTHDNRFKNKLYYGYGYKRNYGVALQVHYLIHNDFLDVEGLTWYWGPGGQLRFHNGYIFYNDSDGYHEEVIADIDLGPDITIGFEYTFSEVPISIALDLTGFLEVINRVRFYEQAGLMVRYNL